MIWTTLGETFLIRASTIESNWLLGFAADGAWARAWIANTSRAHCKRMARRVKSPAILRERNGILRIRETHWPGRLLGQHFVLIVRPSLFNFGAFAPSVQACEG